MHDLKQWLIDKGFKSYNNHLKSEYNMVDWYAARRTNSKRDCECNNRPVNLVVWPCSMRIPDGAIHESTSIEVTGEYNGLWYKLEAYSLSVDELKKNFDKIEESLVRAWEEL